MGQMTRLIGKMTEKSVAELKPKASYYNYLQRIQQGAEHKTLRYTIR